MDWSLVLASQNIAAVIEHRPEGEGWLLLVEPHEYERAVAALRQYRLENRRWHWRQPLAWSGLTFHWGALVWCAALIALHRLAEAFGTRLEDAALMDSSAFRQGQWWRALTAIGLHADVGHLASNVSTGFLVLGLAMARYGPGCGLLAAFLAGVGGNLAGFVLHRQPYLGLGASGMVMGGLGLLAVQSFPLFRGGPNALRRFLTAGFGGLCLFILLGLDPASDVLAHCGGFVAGTFLGALLVWFPESLAKSAWTDRAALGILAGLVAAAWILALR